MLLITNAANFFIFICFVVFFCYFVFPKNQYFNESNECGRMQRKDNDLNAGTIKQQQLLTRKKKLKKNILAIATEKTRRSSRFSCNMVIVFSLQSFIRHCSGSFCCSRLKRLVGKF